MASPKKRALIRARVGQGGSKRDPGPQDLTGPIYLTRPELGARTVRVLSGRGIDQPGYTIIGTQPDGLSEVLTGVRVLKMVSPLTGQGPTDPRATGYFANMDDSVVGVKIARVQKSVAPNTNLTVVRPPKTAIRRLNNAGQGTVEYF